MFLRKLGIWIVKNLIVLLLITFIFSTVALNLPDLVKGMFNDIFQYSSPEMQKEVVGKLTLTCSSLERQDLSALQQQFAKSTVPFDLSKIGTLCKDYNSNKINDKEFFFSVIGTAIPEKFELPKAGVFEKYNSIVDILTKNKIIYLLVLAVLLVLLYLLIMDVKVFIITLAGISFSMGILILLPYAAIIAYSKLVGFDTTPLLSSIFQGSFSFDIKAIISVILLMILRTYTSFIIMLGGVFLGIGIAGKVYGWRLKRKENIPKIKPEKDKKLKEEKTTEERPAKEKKTKEELEEEYRHRDRTTKEILDDLEDMHKKKMKEKE